MLAKLKQNKLIIIIVLLALIGGGYVLYQQSLLRVTETLEGIGPVAKRGNTVVFDYRAFLYDAKAPNHLGREFDSSYSRKEPLKAILGASQVIPGLEKALMGMKPGGQRKAIIAPSMGYGEAGAGDGLVPPSSTLVYLIELRSME